MSAGTESDDDGSSPLDNAPADSEAAEPVDPVSEGRTEVPLDTASELEPAATATGVASRSLRHAFVADGRERRWPLLAPLLERFGRELENALEGRFRTRLPVELVSVRSLEHADLIESLAPDTLLGASSLEPLPGEVWWAIDRGLLAGLADRWFGGPGDIAEALAPPGPSERRLLADLVSRLDGSLGAAWSPLGTVQPVPVGNATADRLARDRPAAARLDCRLRISTGAGAAELRLLLSPVTMTPLERDPGNAGTRASIADDSERDPLEALLERAPLGAGVRDCEVELSGVLAECAITLGEVMRLQPGDFIALDERQTVSFRSGGRAVFDARVGTVDGRVSASVIRLHRERPRA